MKENKRSNVGFGSSYHKGSQKELGGAYGIGTVLGGQVWMVKPDNKAKTINPCIWMASGVVEFKSCNNFGDCSTCKYDAGMQMKVSKGNSRSWQDAMRMRADMDRVCRHTLTGRIAKRSCAYNYECSHCDFDQFMEDVWAPKTKSMPFEIQHVKGFDVPMDYYFHGGHTWARIESGGFIRIGVDDFALKLLGKADALDMPLMGKELDQNKAGWGLRRKDLNADVLSPIGGVIVEVNSQLRENPGLANREPYGDGWLFVVRTPDIKGMVNKLMVESGSLDWMNGEVGRLEKMVEEVAGPMATDGGFFQEDIYGNLPQLGWNNLTRNFLRT